MVAPSARGGECKFAARTRPRYRSPSFARPSACYGLGLFSLALISLIASASFAQETGGLDDDQVIEEFHSCVLSSIAAHDDRISAAVEVAKAAVKACDVEAQAAAKAARRGQDDSDRFYAALQTGNYFVPAVMEDRLVQKDAEALLLRAGDQAAENALTMSRDFAQAGDKQKEAHWQRVAFRVQSLQVKR
jgi:hypothetical protein